MPSVLVVIKVDQSSIHLTLLAVIDNVSRNGTNGPNGTLVKLYPALAYVSGRKVPSGVIMAINRVIRHPL